LIGEGGIKTTKLERSNHTLLRQGNLWEKYGGGKGPMVREGDTARSHIAPKPGRGRMGVHRGRGIS